MTTAVVSGTMATKRRNGGEPWVRLSWVLGLQRLGFDAYFVEQIEPDQCVDADGRVVPLDESENLVTFKRIVREFGLSGRAALVTGDGERTYGLSYPELVDLAEGTDLLINITGQLR